MIFLKRILLTVLSLGAVAALAAQSLSADFDTGSMGRVLRCDSSWLKLSPDDSMRMCSLELLSKTDPDNPVDAGVPPSSRWFHFRIDGVRGSMVFIKIPNTEMQQPFYSYDGVNYMRFGRAENLFPNTVDAVFERDTVYVAYFAPYTHARHEQDMARWSRLPFADRETIGFSGNGAPVDMLTVTDPSVPDSVKRKVWIHARVHTSEAPSSWHLAALVDRLTDTTRLAAEIRRRSLFYVVPETNPDGVTGGYSRSDSSGVNLEINWARPDSLTAPEVTALKSAIRRLTADRPMDVALNMHSQVAPRVTYWIHTAGSTSDAFFRREMLLSALTMNHTTRYAPGEQSFSALNERYCEGWIWNMFGEHTLAMTFETPYTYYNDNPGGGCVMPGNLARLAEASLLALSDLLDLGGAERRVVDSEGMKRRGEWSERCDGRIFFGESYLTAAEAGASVQFDFGHLPAGTYDLYRWVPGPQQTDACSGDDNRWVEAATLENRRDGRLRWTYRAAAAGEMIDAVLLVRRP